MPSQPPRRLALQLLREWEDGSTFAADLIQESAISGRLAQRDRALVQRILFAYIRNRSLIDHFLKELATGKLDPKTRRILRLGLTEALFLENSPHALVNESVKMAGWSKGIVNAVLRRALKEKDKLLAAAEDLPPELRWSIPRFLWKRWVKQFGPEDSLALAKWSNQPSEVYLRLNPHPPDAAVLATSSDLEPVPAFPDYHRLTGQLDTSWFRNGLAYAQDPSTSAAVDLLDAQPGESVLDACAAPGGKTFAISCKAPEAQLYCTDRSPDRIAQMQRNLETLQVPAKLCQTYDWLEPEAHPGEGLPAEFDRILVDAPCSNTGVVRRRIDVRWRLQAADFEMLQETQQLLLASLASRVKPGGVMVYSTCSLEHSENEAVTQHFLDSHPDYTLLEQRRVLPWVQQVDGAYCAALKRNR